MTARQNNIRLIVPFAIVAIASLLLGVIGTVFIKSPAQVAADKAAPPQTLLTAKIESRALTDTILISGTVALGNTLALTPQAPLDGKAAIATKIPLAIGSQFQAGAVLLEISDRPLIALASPIPLIRDLTIGDSGPDVSRFQQALRSAGLVDSDRDGKFGSSTASAVKLLYRHAGYAAPTQGGRAIVTRSEIALVPISPYGQVTALGAAVGAAATGAWITISTAPPSVVANVASEVAAKFTVGLAVDITIAGKTFPGTVSQVGVAVQNPNAGFQVPITITPATPLDPSTVGLAAQVSANLIKSSSPGLLVPLAALYSDSRGQTSVRIVKNGHQEWVKVAVIATGDGDAEITSSSSEVADGASVRLGVAR